MKKLFLLFASTLALLSSLSVNAQCPLPDCYIKGSYVQVGISKSGAFGGCTAPTGYNPKPGGTSRNLGFVADPDMDGWLVAAPGKTQFMGDYFVPGSPYEAWDVQFDGTKYSSNNCPSGGTLGGSTAYGNVSYTATATEQTSVWEGTIGNLSIKQTTTVRKEKLYFVMFVDLVNTGTTTLNNVYYQRALDPDNEQPWTFDFYTINKVVFQPNSISKNCLVQAMGQVYSNSYLGLGTKDCRARCYSLNSGLSTSAQLNNIYAGTGAASGFYYNVGSGITYDVGVGLVFNLGNLAPGQKTSLAYTYILKQADLDSALNETAPKFESDGVAYAPFSTFRVCPGKTVRLKLINGGQYQWVWTTATAPTYMTAIGTSTAIPAGGTIPTITGSKVYPTGAIHGDSIEVTVMGPKTYIATGISNCDTQIMTFYVDTINFTTRPSVSSPVRYCEGFDSPTALAAGSVAGATLNWYADEALSGPSTPTGPTPSTGFSPTETTDFDTTSYWVTQTNAAGCETPPSRIDVIVTRKPDTPSTKDLLYCKGDTTSALTAEGVNLKWYDDAGVRIVGLPTPSSVSAAVLVYGVTQTINGCESDVKPLTVTISEVVADFIPHKDSLCGDEPISIENKTTSSPAGTTFKSHWEFGDGATRDDWAVSHSYADARGTYTIRLEATNQHGCKDVATKVIEVFPKPVMSVSASDSLICQGNAIDFTGTVTAGYRGLTWDFGDSDPAYNVEEVRHAFTTSGTFNVQLNGEYPACPGANATTTVNVIAIPNVNLGNDTGFCPGSTVLVLRDLNTTKAEKYIWNTGDTSETIEVRGAGEYSVRAQNWQCSASDSITVSKGCYLDIPNAFAPGSGGDYGGYFLPRELLSKSVLSFEMHIFDRWGQLIFETDKVNGRGWDGNYKGQAMPMGVYVYLIRVSFANGISESYNGNLTLMR